MLCLLDSRFSVSRLLKTPSLFFAGWYSLLTILLASLPCRYYTTIRPLIRYYVASGEGGGELAVLGSQTRQKFVTFIVEYL